MLWTAVASLCTVYLKCFTMEKDNLSREAYKMGQILWKASVIQQYLISSSSVKLKGLIFLPLSFTLYLYSKDPTKILILPGSISRSKLKRALNIVPRGMKNHVTLAQFQHTYIQKFWKWGYTLKVIFLM